ncbi:MAG: hypothetical protein HS126_03230 [Anaerolineales bacterium]|nr:hypothetical protein [Anaerolineales bacterium]
MASPCPFETDPDSLVHWMQRYLDLAVTDLRPAASTKKIVLHLEQFRYFFVETYGDDRLSTCLHHDVQAWQTSLRQQFAPAMVNNYLASLSGFTHWLQTHNPDLFPGSNPTKGVGEVPLPLLEPRTLSNQTGVPNDVHAYARPWRDQAIVFFLLSIDLRREELVHLDSTQVEPHTIESLRRARKVRVSRVRAKAKLSARSSSRPMPAWPWPIILNTKVVAMPARSQQPYS